MAPQETNADGEKPYHDYSWKVPIDPMGGTMILENAEGETGHYEPLQFHFHAPSEHTVHGDLYAAELHIVHLGCRDELEGKDCGQVAVLGIFFDLINDKEDNEFLE